MAEQNTFEESLKNLEKVCLKLKSDDTTLEEAISSYEEGIKYYRECKEFLDKANQKIETLAK